MTDDRTDAAADALSERLHTIEERPLAERAAAYAALHDELLRALDTTSASEESVGT